LNSANTRKFYTKNDTLGDGRHHAMLRRNFGVLVSVCPPL